MTNIRLHVGDCLDVLRGYPENSFDSVITDPPYGIAFMSKGWDHGVPGTPFWLEVFRVLKPGGYLAAFGGTRTYHRLACAIEDAGFEVRDSLHWVFGQAMPHSKDTSKALDIHFGLEREVIGYKRGVGGENLNDIVNGREEIRSTEDEGGKGVGAYGVGAKQIAVDIPITAPASEAAKRYVGWGSNLKPAHEPVVIARKPLVGTVAENVLQYGTGAINIDGCRVPSDGSSYSINRFTDGAKPFGGGAGHDYETVQQQNRWPANVIITPDPEVLAVLPAKAPAYFNQFPYSEEDAQSLYYCAKAGRKEREEGLDGLPSRTGAEAVGRKEGSIGVNNPRAGASRTASKVKNFHPTVKPLALMAWLVRLLTPPGGAVLDPFMGSGSTGVAAVSEGFGFVGIDLDAEYVNIARHRIANKLKM